MSASSRFATRTATAIVVLTMAVAPTACVGAADTSDPPSAGDDSAAPSAEGIDRAAVGLEWHTVELSGPLDGETSFESFGTRDALWLYQPDFPTTLHTTSDGATWRTIDLAASGLPADAQLVRGPEGVVTDDLPGSTTIVYTTYTMGSHPAALDVIQWLVELTANGVTVTPGAAVGLEAMPQPEAGWAFRTGTIAAFAHLGDTRVAVGGGQWWQPFLTSRYDGFAAVNAGGTWQIVSSEAVLPFGVDARDVRPISVSEVGDRLVMLGADLGDPYPFLAFTSKDGRSWQDTSASFSDATGATYRVQSIAVGASGIVAAGIEGDKLTLGTGSVVVWASVDGSKWTRSALPVTDGVAVTVIDRGSDYLVLTEADFTVQAFTSTDGVTWVLSDAELPYAASSVVKVAGGLVAQYTSGMQVSGLDWGLTP